MSNWIVVLGIVAVVSFVLSDSWMVEPNLEDYSSQIEYWIARLDYINRLATFESPTKNTSRYKESVDYQFMEVIDSIVNSIKKWAKDDEELSELGLQPYRYHSIIHDLIRNCSTIQTLRAKDIKKAYGEYYNTINLETNYTTNNLLLLEQAIQPTADQPMA